MPQEERIPPSMPSEGGKACLYGCVALVAGVSILMAIVFIGGAIMFRYGTKFIQQTAGKYTDAAPLELPKSELTPEQSNNLFSRLDEFKATLDGKGVMNTLILTGDEINTFFAYQPQLQPIAKYAFFTVKDGKIGGTISYPLDDINLPPMLGLKGRYLNGTAVFDISLVNGRLGVFIDDVIVKGERLPENLMAKMRNENLAKNVLDDPNAQKVVQRIKEISVEDSKLKVTLKEGA